MLRAWLRVCRQWRTAPRGGGMGPLRTRWLGLDAGAVKAALDMAGHALGPEDWERLEDVAAGAAEALNEG